MFAVVETVFILIEKDSPSSNKSQVLLCINLSLNISCGVLMSISTISCGVFCIVNQGPVVQSWISANPGFNINQCLCISVSRSISKSQRMILPLIQTRLLKKYFQVYDNKLLIGKFALYFKFPSCIPNGAAGKLSFAIRAGIHLFL